MRNILNIDKDITLWQLIFSSGARKTDVNATRRYARRMRLLKFGYLLLNNSSIYHLFYFSKFHTELDFILQPEICIYNAKGILNRGSFIVHVLLLGTSKAFTVSISYPARVWSPSVPSARSLDGTVFPPPDRRCEACFAVVDTTPARDDYFRIGDRILCGACGPFEDEECT